MKRIITTALASSSLLAMATSAAAQSHPYQLDLSNLSMEACTIEMGAMSAVANATGESGADALLNYADVRATVSENFRNSPAFQRFEARLAERRQQRQTQVVYLEFNDANPTFFVFNGFDENGDPIPFAGGVFPDFIFDDDAKAEVVEQLETQYALYNVEFVTEIPAQGEFSTIQIGANDQNPINLRGGILFGRADNIDFGNNDRNDNAFSDGSFWQLIAELDANFGTQNFQAILGLPDPLTLEEVEEFRRSSVINQSANTTAHELGHILGLRHHDAIGAPGMGLPDTGEILPEDFFPVLETDLNASESIDHIMASGASVGLPLENPPQFDRFFGERSANKLNFNERGRTRFEDRIRRFSRPFAPLFTRAIANPLLMGENAGTRLLARRLVVRGAIEEIDQVDDYVMFLRDGQVFNAEIISNSDNTFEDFILGTTLTLSRVNFRGDDEVVAVNQRTFEGFEPLIFDYTIEGSGFYKLSVTVPDIVTLTDGTELSLTEIGLEDFRTGDYDLHAYSVDGRGNSRSASRFSRW